MFELIDGGISINSCTDYGATVLRSALEGGRLDLAAEILRRGFDPKLTYKRPSSGEFIEIGMGPLGLAAKLGAEGIIDGLLAGGVCAYSKFFGEEPFEDDAVKSAIKANQQACLKKLLTNAEPEIVAKRVAQLSYPYLSECKDTALIGILVEFGANVNATSQMGPFPSVLHTYAQRGWTDGVVTALKMGADPTREDAKEVRAEDVATSPELRRMLVLAAMRLRMSRGREAENLEASDAMGRSRAKSRQLPDERPAIELFELAINQSEEAAIERLKSVSAASLRVRDDRGWSLLNYAIRYKCPKLAAALVDGGADIANFTARGSSIIGFAAQAGDLDLVRKLAAKGAVIDAAKNGTATALIVAVDQRNMPMVKLLLSLGAKSEPPRPEAGAIWRSALMLATRTGDTALMEEIVRAGGDLHAIDSSGEGLVFYAARSGNVDALNWVIARGVDPFLKTPDGTNALTLAASLGQIGIIKALVTLGVSHPDAEAYAEHYGKSEAVAFFREQRKRANPDDPSDFWNRWNITTDEVRRYIEAGKDVNYASCRFTPLQQMASLLNAEAVSLLLDRGADPAKYGRSLPLAVFLSFQANDATDDKSLVVLRAFIEHGVSPNSHDYVFSSNGPEKSPTGRTLLNCAIAAGYVKCARYLLETGADPMVRSSFPGMNAFDELSQTLRIDERERFELRKLMESRAASDRKASPQPRAIAVESDHA